MQHELGCADWDFKEINAADFKGIDTVRSIRREYDRKAIAGKCRMYHIDECHGLTSDAQNAFLKMLEDTPDDVYFILSTTNPTKILPTIKTRCMQIPFKSLAAKDLEAIVRETAEAAKIKLGNEVIDKLVEVANGSARQILVDLQKIAPIKSRQGRLDALVPPQILATAMTVVNALIPFKGKGDWNSAVAAIKECADDLEKVRQTVLSCAANHLMNNMPAFMKHRAYLVIVAFSEPFFNSGKAGMLAACWQVFNTK